MDEAVGGRNRDLSLNLSDSGVIWLGIRVYRMMMLDKSACV